MTFPSINDRRALALLVCCLLLAGCAGRLPRTYPLTVVEKEHVLSRFEEFLHHRCLRVLDADVTLEMQMLGKSEIAPGMLQAMSPSYLRYTVADPLGRSLAIVVTDGTTFTMVDNRRAEAVTGPVESGFWYEFFPPGVYVEDFIPWLTGRLPDQDFQINATLGDRDDPTLVWMISPAGEGMWHDIGFDFAAGVMRRHILRSETDNKALLDVRYIRYNMEDAQCPLPMELEVAGQSITGTLLIRFDRIFTDTTLSPRIFLLDIPDHYTVEEVE